MISFKVGDQRFNHRVAAIAMRNGHVLVCHEDDDDYVMLPGGRVELGEPSPVALAREMAEELGVEAPIDRLLFTEENFFEREGEAFHQIGIYYQVALPADFPFVTGKPCLVRFDEGLELKFIWVPATSAALAQVNLKPIWLRDALETPQDGSRHVVVNEGARG
jgi:8-oxo-dGTP pyrophosphatase MutT (NUDIX family)